MLGGWRFNGLALFTSGQPYHPIVNGDIAGTGMLNRRYRANYVGNPHLSNPTPAAWLNKSAFEIPQAGTFGNAGRNTLRADGINNVDFSLFKIFSIKDRVPGGVQGGAVQRVQHPAVQSPGLQFQPRQLRPGSGIANRARQIQMGLKLKF